MNLDKPFLIKLLKDNKDNAYLLKLYEVYSICNKVTGGNIAKEKARLEALEDKIYTINGKTLSQKERIVYEMKKIHEVLSNLSPQELLEKYQGDSQSLINLLENRTLPPNVVSLLKEQIVVLQAKLGLPINFFYSAATVFQDIYETEYVNNYDIYNRVDKSLLDEHTVMNNINKKYFKDYNFNNNDLYNKEGK